MRMGFIISSKVEVKGKKIIYIYIYGCIDEKGSWRMGESGDYLTSCMEMTWFCVVSRRMT